MRTLYTKGFLGGPYGFISRTGGSGTPPVDELLSIAVTPSNPTWRPTASSDRQQFTATGTYSISGDVDITTLVTWTSGTVGTATISNAGGTEGEATAVSANNGTDGTATTTVITATLGAVSGNTTLSVDTDRDATSGIRCPSNLYQWQTLLGYTPTALYLCQEASGNLADSIGSATLTANASPNYQQSVTGWTRSAVTFGGVASQRFLNTTFANSATTSLLALAFIGFTGAPAASSYMMTYGGADDCSVTAGSGGQQRFRYRESGNIVEAAGTYTNPTIYPLTLKRDITNSVARVYTDSEKLTPTFGATVGSNFSIGAQAGTSAAVACLYLVVFTSTAAEQSEASDKALIKSLGMGATWT